MKKDNLLIIDAPELSDEGASNMLDFIHTFMDAFESHYYCQLQCYYHRRRCEPSFCELAEREDPF